MALDMLGLGLSSDSQVEDFVESEIMLRRVKGGDRKLLLSAYLQSTNFNSTVFTALTILFFVQIAMQIANGGFSPLSFLITIFASLASIYLAFVERRRYAAVLRLFAKA